MRNNMTVNPSLLVDWEFCYNRKEYNVIQNTEYWHKINFFRFGSKVSGFDISRKVAVGDYLITMSHSVVIIPYLNFKRSEFYFITSI